MVVVPPLVDELALSADQLRVALSNTVIVVACAWAKGAKVSASAKGRLLKWSFI
jgi:hypothetical protein